MIPDMSPEAIEARLRRLSAQSDLRAGRRLATKVDMSAEAITGRLRQQSRLRDLCLDLGRAAAAPERTDEARGRR